MGRGWVALAGRAFWVLGKRNAVGTPLSLLLRNCGAASVTVVRAAAEDPAAASVVARNADVLVAAVGTTNLVRAHWVKPGAAVLDVGINAVPSSVADGWRVVGDCAADEVAAVAGALTPVPGGVGPMTIASLLDNVAIAYFKATAE